MSGSAIIIRGANYQNANLGKVTFLQDVAVTGITISANSAYEGTQASLTASYTPSGTNQQGCLWSIVSGSAYATINASTGVLTILSGANANSVTVRATSVFDNTITAEATFNVTYSETVNELTAIAISGDATVNGNTSQYAVAYTPSNSNYKGVLWSITSGSAYATIDATGLLTVLSGANASSVTIKATSTHDSSIIATKTITVTYKEASIVFADAAVKAILVSKFDTNADGEITNTEANNVTSLIVNNTEIFTGNTSIVSFLELSQFKNVTKLNTYAEGTFNACSNLESVDLTNITEIGDRCFRLCPKLKNLVSVLNVKTIGSVGLNCGYDSDGLYETLEFSSALTSIASSAIHSAALKWIKFNGTTPPAIQSDSFVKSNYKIFVPDAAYDTYMAAANWSSKTNIYKMSTFSTYFPS